MSVIRGSLQASTARVYGHFDPRGDREYRTTRLTTAADIRAEAQLA